MKVLYLAHKIRDQGLWQHQQNIRAAEAVALTLWQAGAAIICPGKNTEFFDGAAEDDTWLNGDLEILKRCDAIIMGPFWRESVGARREREEAIVASKPVFFWPEDKQAIWNFIKDIKL